MIYYIKHLFLNFFTYYAYANKICIKCLDVVDGYYNEELAKFPLTAAFSVCICDNKELLGII